MGYKKEMVVVILVFEQKLSLSYEKIAAIINKIKDQKIEKIKSVLTISLKNHYHKIVANDNNTRVRDQEDRNKIFSIY